MSLFNIFVVNSLKFNQTLISNIKGCFAANSFTLDNDIESNYNPQNSNNQLGINQNIIVGKVINLHINQSFVLNNNGVKTAGHFDISQVFFITYLLDLMRNGVNRLVFTQLLTLIKSKFSSNLLVFDQVGSYKIFKILISTNTLILRSYSSCYKTDKNYIAEVIENPPITGIPICE